MAEITVGEVSPAQFEQLNAMCVPSGSGAQAVHSEVHSAVQTAALAASFPPVLSVGQSSTPSATLPPALSVGQSSTPSASQPTVQSPILSAMKESAEALRHASAPGLRVFGAFLDSEPVGRLELSPIEATPVPLTIRSAVQSTVPLTAPLTGASTVPPTVPLPVTPTGHGVWVIRCFWVLDKAKGMGLGRRLMELALDAVATEPVAVLTYDNWMPPAFLEKFGFRQVQRQVEAILMVRGAGGELGEDGPEGSAPRATPDSTLVSFTAVTPTFDVSPDCVRVDVVYTPRCPWRIVNARQRLADARELSDRVVTQEHRLLSREDALCWGEEYTYVDGEPLSGGPVTKDVLLKAVTERLRAKGLMPR
jgi:GNAT superfamily N-acetyltransferase